MLFTSRLSPLAKIALAITLAAATACLSLYVVGTSALLQRFENRFLDFRYLIRSDYGHLFCKPIARPDPAPIVMVFIDNDSAMNYGYRSPTPRRLIADVIDQLAAKGASAIGIDVLLDRSYNKEEDDILEAALVRHGKRVVLVSAHPSEKTERFGESLTLLARFTNHTYTGFSASHQEGDDYVRWVSLQPEAGQLPFAMRMYEVFSGKPCILPERLNLHRNHGFAYVNFPGEATRLTSDPPNFNVYASSEVEFLPAEFFTNKMVVVGSSIEELGDVMLCPFSTKRNGYKVIFGMELHAIALSMIHHNRFLYDVAPGLQVASLFVLFLAGACAFLFLRPVWTLLSLPLLIGGWIELATWAFIRHSLVLPVAFPILGIVLILVLCLWMIYITELKHSGFLKQSFSHYISPELVEKLVSKQENLSLGGREEELTILFSDLKGFTTLSENLTPNRLVEVLCTYFDSMTPILINNKGTLDKYIGDAVMAFWGAPSPMNDHAVLCVRTAVLMQKAMAELNANPIPGWQTLVVRIGVNTGRVIAGNMGSRTRFNYTVMGDAVNLASRLEGLNKELGSRILMTDTTLESLLKNSDKNDPQSRFLTRQMGRFCVKGKAKWVAVYQVFGFESDATPQDHLIKQRYERALQDFYAGNFDAAEPIFKKLQTEFEDLASEYMLEHLKQFRAEPPPPGWQGEIVLHTK